jgi:hypothetical protein
VGSAAGTGTGTHPTAKGHALTLRPLQVEPVGALSLKKGL